ncbi:DNA cytosine methyltransferase [Kitasatospora cineracea]|uniref:DNA cytosine methyltransferase n=1 Tax=Kitasatospora cineracea TaxID=88074 RepID=UPI003827DCFF
MGLNSQTRSGLWLHVARAVEALRPCLLVVENVRGLLTSPGSAGNVEPCPWCMGDDPTLPSLRALGAVLGTLADLRYDARWLVLRASDVGAPHHRSRVFLTAWPADHGAEDAHQQHREERRQPAPGEAQEWRTRPEPGRRGGVAAADAAGGRHRHRGAPGGEGPAPRGALVEPILEAAPERWGQYAPAVTRWETFTRPAPPPTDEGGRLRPAFVEWMQGLDDGWVTATPGLGRPAQLTALGNGVVPQQAARALELLAPPLGRCPRCQLR